MKVLSQVSNMLYMCTKFHVCVVQWHAYSYHKIRIQQHNYFVDIIMVTSRSYLNITCYILMFQFSEIFICRDLRKYCHSIINSKQFTIFLLPSCRMVFHIATFTYMDLIRRKDIKEYRGIYVFKSYFYALSCMKYHI